MTTDPYYDYQKVFEDWLKMLSPDRLEGVAVPTEIARIATVSTRRMREAEHVLRAIEGCSSLNVIHSMIRDYFEEGE